jgi:phage tail sheath protein FI
MAGIYNQVDRASGIWRSPAGTAWPIQAKALAPALTTADFDELNAHNISAIREFDAQGIVPWGARVLDRVNLENRFIAAVRMRDWLAASIERGLAFTARSANDETLWSQIRMVVNDFLAGLYQDGAFAGTTPDDAYFVRCDATTTTEPDIEAHRVNVMYGYAMLRAGEFDRTTLTLTTYEAGRKASRPLLRAMRWDEEMELNYPTEPGTEYQLEFSPELGSAPWSPVPDILPVEGDGAWRQVRVPLSSAQRAYRVRATPQGP